MGEAHQRTAWAGPRDGEGIQLPLVPTWLNTEAGMVVIESTKATGAADGCCPVPNALRFEEVGPLNGGQPNGRVGGIRTPDLSVPNASQSRAPVCTSRNIVALYRAFMLPMLSKDDQDCSLFLAQIAHGSRTKETARLR